MKFLLVGVNAKYIHSNPAIYSLKAYATMKDNSLEDKIEIAEYTINMQMEEILSDLYDRKPDVVGFSCYIWNISYIHQLVHELPKLLPFVKIFLGGPEVTYDAKAILLKEKTVTGIMLGEGEETFLELMQYYANDEEKSTHIPLEEKAIVHGSLEDINGLAISKGEDVYFTAPRELTNLSDIPFLYYDLSQFENKIIYYESSRGCPFRCSYCLSSIDKKVRLRDIEIVKKELQFFLDARVSQVKFVDRTFNCNKQHAMEIWRYIKENDNGITNFHFEVEADLLDNEEIAILSQMRKGAVQFEIGVQSTNEATIREIDRVMSVEKLSGVVSQIHAAGNIHVHLDLIAGLPLEDYTSFQKSFNDVYAMKPEQLQLGFLKVLKGSKMCEKATGYGIVYSDLPPYEVMYTNWISYEEIRRLKRVEEMVELYYNSNQFTTTLPILLRWFESPFMFYEKLSEYYLRKGYFVKTPQRSRKYEILLDFMKEWIQKEIQEKNCKNPAGKGLGELESSEVMDLLKESLTMDMYLRENCKSRPSFAEAKENFSIETREKIHAFLEREIKLRKYLTDKAYDGFDVKSLSRMTHIEIVHFDFCTGEKTKKRAYLFDYQNRDPLTYKANVTEIEIENTSGSLI